MKKGNLSVIVLIFLLVSIGNCFAFTYVESDSGDLNNTDIGSLDVGINYVKGTFGIGSTIYDDEDSFFFTIDTGMTLNSLWMEFDTIYYNDNTTWGQSAGIRWEVRQVSPETYEAGDFVNLLGASSIDPWTGFTGLGPGYYKMSQQRSNSAGDRWTADYTLSLITTGSAAVPIPGTISLLGLGLLGLAGLKRKKQ